MKPAPVHVVKTALALLALAVLGGCAHKARHSAVPSAAKMEASHARLAAAVGESRALHTQAVAAAAQARRYHDGVTVRLAAFEPKVDKLLAEVPADLRPEVQALKDDLAALRAEQAEGTGAQEELRLSNTQLGVRLDAMTVLAALAAKDRADYQAEMARMTAAKNTAEDAWAKDSAKIVWMTTHSLLFTLAGITGLLGVGLVLFLKFTGRLATSAAAVAARL